MLSARERLRRSADFALAVRRGRRAGRGTLVVHLYDRQPDGAQAPGESSPPRVGFVVPRSVGGAVVRNRVKRRLRHLVRERQGQLPCGSLVVVRALPRSAQVPYADLAADFDAATARLAGLAQRGPGRRSGGVR